MEAMTSASSGEETSMREVTLDDPAFVFTSLSTSQSIKEPLLSGDATLAIRLPVRSKPKGFSSASEKAAGWTLWSFRE